ncbi:LysR substrate-binding domain-containing protein [Vibrio sp. EA2]|uniref:LysR substrate-binding domain-containing protein n=1 Tax=Vibrio sp. EA2 TaxID=3079860 RepID=UPI00294A22ED|nr:LysR substrate-binding domain-containing protein [Vibrio sp. EA2]MDV6253556.1 LysR substrate-binding domain-containing protein [Vibrio sp. EA2]
MDKLKSMQVFVYAVDTGSFRNAANHFELSATMVGKHIQFLESSLNTRLLNRTTRKQSLTESGQIYYKECKRIIDEISLAENRIHTLENTPMGTVRVNSPVSLGSELLAPIVADFLQAYPSLNAELTLDNSIVDPLLTDADVLLRVGELADSSMIARKVGEYKMHFCAAPSYIERMGVPDSLNDLQYHSCLGFVFSQGQTMQSLKLDTDAFNRLNTRLASNNGHALKAAAIYGAGIVLQPDILVREDIENGLLMDLLEEYVPEPKPVYLMYRNRELSLKNRAFVDYVIGKTQQLL